MFDVNHQPKNMTVDELESGLRWLFSEVYNEREFRRRKRHYMEIVKARPPRTAPGRRDEAGTNAAHYG